MHRFRKKSDAQRSPFQIPTSALPFDSPPSNALPELPPTNDFRTSLILPDLSRRFSLLRSSTGDPVSFDQLLRTRLANQRAQGAENQISEEEEDMLLETLGKLRFKGTHSSNTPSQSQENVVSANEGGVAGGIGSAEDGLRNSVRSGVSMSNASVTSSGTGRSAKRYSNNLFGSGRLRDHMYMKSVAGSSTTTKGSGSSTRTVSLTPTEASMATMSNNMSATSLRPTTPDGSTSSPLSSVQSSPAHISTSTSASTSSSSTPTATTAATTNEGNGPIPASIRSAPLIPPAPYGDSQSMQSLSDAEYRLQKRLGPSVLKRASMAIEQAIKEIEDEVEDEILLPRSTPIPRGSLDNGGGIGTDVRNSHASNNSSIFEGGMAISIDKTIHDEFSERRASPVPARTVPGYVPGMPRPMTPLAAQRDFMIDVDEQRSHSTTPRAQSPFYPDPPASPSPALSGLGLGMAGMGGTKPRRDSTSSMTKPMPAAPLFLQRSTNGRYTPTQNSASASADDGSYRSAGGGNGDTNSSISNGSSSNPNAIDFDSPLSSSLLGRRRPASPLSGPPYQPMAVSSNSRPNSRPSTPSNVIWTPNPHANANGANTSTSNYNSNGTSYGVGNGNAYGQHKQTHSRNNSWTTDTGSDFHHGSLNSKPAPRSLKSPALPDSPMLEAGEGMQYSFASAGSSTGIALAGPAGPEKLQAYLAEVELGSPILAAVHAPRSPTPTQSQNKSNSQIHSGQRSPISPAFSDFDLSPRPHGSKHSSRQNHPSNSASPSPSPFNISSFSGLGFAARGGNSSRSSLDSVGSSFHSWDEAPDKVLNVFSEAKDQSPAWHDFGLEDKDGKEKPRRSPSHVNGDGNVTAGEEGSSETDWETEAEDVLKKHSGLKKSDIAAIQGKLVTAAFTKIANTDPRDRAPSSMRRRRPSTSQSNYSRIASPPPQAQPPASPSAYTADDQYTTKASALLNSVVESIKDLPPALNTNTTSQISSPDEVSPSTRRNRDLARVLFGGDDAKEEDETVKFDPLKSSMRIEPPQPISTNSSVTSTTDHIVPHDSDTTTTPSAIDTTFLPSPSLSPPPEPATAHHYPSPYLHTRNPSTPRIPQTPKEEAELAREVQQKADAAMIALNKNPSRVNLPEGIKHNTSIRRRVSPSQISTPTFVSTTTSVETVPLPAHANGSTGPSKLGSRFKKLRGSLRAKTVIQVDEEPRAPPEIIKTPPASQTAYYDPAQLNPPIPLGPSSASASDSGRFKVPVSSPPASAGPGLKGFMARFRNKQRMSEMPSSSSGSERERQMPRAVSPLSPNTPLTPRSVPADPTTPNPLTTPTERSHNMSPRPAGQPKPMYSRFPPANPPQAPAPAPQSPSQPSHEPATSTDAAALEQLFAAANNLGLDQNALNDLLARSGSTSSRNYLLHRNNSLATASRPGSSKETAGGVSQVAYVGSSSSDQTATPTDYSNPQQSKALLPESPVTPEEAASRKPSARRADHLRRPKEGQTENPANAIVRRTIIYAHDAADFSALIQRKTSTRRKRASATSVSSRSVHDRAPTPPPSKSPAVRRFSADGMPPMPQLPNSLGQGGEKMLNVPSTSTSGPVEKSNSTYDSLYDMYAGESRAASMAVVDTGADAHSPTDQPALEVIELANGETVWSIINGLRDADDESIYSRTSFTSDYSTREPGNDSLQVFSKDHNRTGSKGSTSSFVSKKKPQQGKVRPETKVFHSSSAQIGRLIESLSQGADAGSFNFMPNVPNRPGHSASSSLSTNDINWTVEERLERMLGAMNNP